MYRVNVVDVLKYEYYVKITLVTPNLLNAPTINTLQSSISTKRKRLSIERLIIARYIAESSHGPAQQQPTININNDHSIALSIVMLREYLQPYNRSY